MEALTRRMRSNDQERTGPRSQGKADENESSSETGSTRHTPSHDAKIEWARVGWLLHFTGAVIILCIGMYQNGGLRKYAPAPLSAREGMDCDKAYINVLATSSSMDDAVVCCQSPSLSSILGLNLCPSKGAKLPFANRLAKFPDAWILPLFPILLRILCLLFQAAISHSYTYASNISFQYAARRLIFYILLLNLRGWVLYMLLSKVEDLFVSPVNETCWLHGWLQGEHRTCLGRAFDFSDHIVLYYAQILPIALHETLYGLQYPYWYGTQVQESLVPFALVTTHLYLQFITAIGVYKTAAYFHSPGEVVVGFVLSLAIAAPLALLQCSTQPQWKRWKSFLFAYR